MFGLVRLVQWVCGVVVGGSRSDGRLNTLQRNFSTPPLPCWLWAHEDSRDHKRPGIIKRIQALAAGGVPQGRRASPRVLPAATFLHHSG